MTFLVLSLVGAATLSAIGGFGLAVWLVRAPRLS